MNFTGIVTSAWADNMKLDALNAARKLNAGTVGSTQATDKEHFWATPERHGDDDSEECMEITLSNERLVNHISFDLAKFPHDCELEYFDVKVGIWKALFEAEMNGDEPCRFEMRECNPPVLPPLSSMNNYQHPHHSFSGHWQPAEFFCKPVRFQRLRVVLRRHTRARLPCGPTGIRVAYSLAIRSLYCGYKVYSKACVPTPEPILTSYTEHKEFATTTDILGSNVSYSYRVNRAENVLLNDPNAQNPSQTLIWRSEPQPFPYAVVNYFADVRDNAGEPQVLDRFFLDPLTDGANVNLYYSNDEPDDDFEAPDEPLPSPVAVINGQTAGPGPLSRDDHPYGRVCWVDVDNSSLCFRPGRRWWFGVQLNWKFLRTIDLFDHPVFDCDEFHIAWTRYGMRFATRHGDYFHVDCDDFHPASDFQLMVGYENGQASMRIQVNNQIFFGERTLSVSLSQTTVTKLRIGGFISQTTVSHDFKLKNLVLKVDESLTQTIISSFFRNPRPYCVRPEFVAYEPLRQSNNAILRYNPEFATNDFPSGFRGGTPTRYSNMEWSPIARDYILRKGFLYFPPTRAKYWKFEFCGLTPQPYEVYVPIKKTVKTYRTEMWMVPVTPPSIGIAISVKVPGISIQVGVAASFNYKTSTLATVRSASVSASIGLGMTNSRGMSLNVSASASVSVNSKYTATSVRIVANAQARVTMTSVSWVWGFLPCHKPVYVPRFEKKCVHEYETIEIQQSTKIGYFVGLRAIQAYKVSYLAADDTAQYVELFQDKSNLDSDTGWVLTGEHELTSGDAKFSQAQSKIMPSNRTVRGLQFATTQSAPIQLLYDDDFDAEDPEINWRAVGDGTLAPFTSFDERVGSILRVDRSSRRPSWTEVDASIYTTWASFEAINATYDMVEASGNPAQSQGGLENRVAASTPPGGRIYAAARVVAPAALQSPLYVQIIDDETGQVLSETGTDVQANQITEWYTSYTIGEGGELRAWRWRDFATNPQYPLYVDNFQRNNAGNLGSMLTNQSWLTENWPHSINANEALTTTSNDYDWVDSITPWGTLEMTVGTMAGTGQPLRPLLYFGPMQVDDQGVVTYMGGRASIPSGSTSVFGRAVQVGDSLRVDIMPMAQVPANRRPAGWVDNVTWPYALVFSLNGTWTMTVGHRMGARTRRGFMGRVNQRFRSFAWTPLSLGPLPGSVLTLIPVAGNGSFDSGRLTWTDNSGYVWTTTGTLDNSTTVGVLTFTSAGAKIVTNVGYWYGTLSAGVRKVAAGTVGKHGPVLCLDADNSVFLDAAGNVVREGVSYGNLVPGGVSDNSFLQVQFMDTKSVAASVRGSIDPAVYPKMIRALVNGSQVGALAFPALQGWSGLRRGLAGDVHDGTAGTPIADFHTSFDSFGWAPDALNVSVDPRTPTWNEVSAKGTGTYDGMAKFLTLNTGRIRARVIQRGASIDVWDMDTLSLFADPIVWSFSNDGGQTFYNAYDIKNDPHGVLLFPEGVVVTATTGSGSGATPGQSMVWRAVSYAPGQKISSLTIRPWYGGLLSGITHRVGTAAGGPNTMPYDHYPPIDEDARFQTWHKPIPQDWFYQFRVLKRTVDQVVPRPKVLLAPEAVTSKYKSEIEGS